MKRTPLKRTPMKRATKAVRRISAKRAEKIDERKILRAEQLRSRPLCEALLSQCRLKASDVHEVINRSQRSTSWLESDKFVSLCRPCHAWVTEHPMWSRHHGYTLSATQSDPAWLDAAARARRKCHVERCPHDHLEEPS